VKLQVSAAAGSNVRRIASARGKRRFAMLNSCGPGVKRLVARQDALAAERDTLNQLLEHAQADASAATAAPKAGPPISRKG
jgi:hypothetical protein